MERIGDVGELTAAEVQRRLDLPVKIMAWLERVERPVEFSGPVLPSDGEAAHLLDRLGVQPGDRAETLSARPDPARHPELWWILDRAYHWLLAQIDRGLPPEGFSGWPAIPSGTGRLGRCLYVWVFLAAVPAVRRYHASRGIPDDVSWVSLAALGREMTLWGRVSGGSGRYAQWVPPLVFCGASYRLGRLAFDRGRHEVNVHIPEDGPLTPAACQDSFDRAREFFPHHFAEDSVTSFVCYSWLLDDQLANYLPEDSNILQFQRRFSLKPNAEQTSHTTGGDREILELVFYQTHDGPELPPEVIEKLPQDTTLQRAFVAHLRAGGHWHLREGRFPF